MAFAAYLQENAILVLSWVGHLHTFFLSPNVGFLYETPGPTLGHFQLFQKKGKCSGGGARLEWTEP